MWISPNEGAKFWLSVLTEIHNRGVKDILIACVDGLTGFPNAIETLFRKTQVQLCIVHMVRNSVAFVPWQQRKQVCADLKAIYAAATESEAEFNLELFAEKWDKQYPSISLDRNDCIEIVRIIHAARDVLQVLAEEDRVGAASMGTTIRSQKATYQGQRISQNLAQSAQS